jgi:PhoPQ-activated pathogenicity-related protein
LVQIKHHREVFGGLSPSAAMFAETVAQAETDRGRNLIGMIDPYTYRERLTMPKLIVLATNDDYYAPDSLNLYWMGLSGPKSILYLPNISHVRANMHPGVNRTAFALVRAMASGKALPKLNWKFETDDSQLGLRLTSDVAPTSVRVWLALAENRDFLAAQWTSQAMDLVPGGREALTYEGAAEHPSKGYLAMPRRISRKETQSSRSLHRCTSAEKPGELLRTHSEQLWLAGLRASSGII